MHILPNINQILSFICIGLERAVLRTFVANFTILQFMRSIRKVFAFPDSDVVTVGFLSFCYHFYRLLLSFVPTHHSFILLFNICDHGFLNQREGGGVCARRKVLQRMEWALTLRPMDKWDPHRTPSKKRDTLKTDTL